MPHHYNGGIMGASIYQGDISTLEGKPPYRDGECVALVQAVTNVGQTGGWRPGPRVVDLLYLPQGTVIANFVFDEHGVGRFPNRHGFHAALFQRFGARNADGRAVRIHVIDQFKGRKPKNRVASRPIDSYGERTHAQGNAISECDNADQFYVVVRL
jgi:hypothetical protein